MENRQMATAITYDRYEILNESVNLKRPKTRFIGRWIYHPVSKWDYNRVMEIFERRPNEYKLVNVDYGFCWKEE